MADLRMRFFKCALGIEFLVGAWFPYGSEITVDRDEPEIRENYLIGPSRIYGMYVQTDSTIVSAQSRLNGYMGDAWNFDRKKTYGYGCLGSFGERAFQNDEPEVETVRGYGRRILDKAEEMGQDPVRIAEHRKTLADAPDRKKGGSDFMLDGFR